MKAEDTVMDDIELSMLKNQHVKETGITRPDIRDYVFAVRDRQAEITWVICWDKAFKAGMKEVVEWVESNYCFVSHPEDTHFRNQWQAKLKEWSLENKI